jgi:flavin reductase (DIM6/NTAB) family NADH-FMN oxidoreductase RutF
VEIDVASGAVHWREVYKLCISFITPRPIALVSTISAAGEPNLAPFSFYNMVSANPPVVMISIGTPREKAAKDTLRNIEDRCAARPSCRRGKTNLRSAD